MHQQGKCSDRAVPGSDQATIIPDRHTAASLAAAAGGQAGLEVLLLFGREPMTCDTAEGFAMRVHRPVAEVGEALGLLKERGVLCASRPRGDRDPVSYWMPADTMLFSALNRLASAYLAGPTGRRLLRAVAHCSPARA